ncbi:nematocyst expressed protein 3-like [Drosophila sulfurigaster albostrigata]|uniref:nematocyst expressed protein 3-like n=1 Tax=Drosophila sulfurigaster albostrigata TaxID=89887 RepID=UPI002D21EDD2|nr:nematocyst expressed protein 3-like [Drosophila sulfurigaster albostrigata]
MRLLSILLLSLCLCLSLSAGMARRLQREASAAPEPAPAPAPEPEPAPEPAAAPLPEPAPAGNEDKEIFISDATTTSKPLGTASIKSRAISMDRGLCQERSRYHPHFPKCHQFCKRLEHWIGQCWREDCHCIS